MPQASQKLKRGAPHRNTNARLGDEPLEPLIRVRLPASLYGAVKSLVKTSGDKNISRLVRRLLAAEVMQAESKET